MNNIKIMNEVKNTFNGSIVDKALVVDGDLVVNGDLLVSGDIEVKGTITTINTEVKYCDLKEAIELCKINNITLLPVHVKSDNQKVTSIHESVDKDFKLDAIGNKVYVGDNVAFAVLNYRGMQKARVIGFSNKGVRLFGMHYYEDKTESEFNRLMSQVVRVD